MKRIGTPLAALAAALASCPPALAATHMTVNLTLMAPTQAMFVFRGSPTTVPNEGGLNVTVSGNVVTVSAPGGGRLPPFFTVGIQPNGCLLSATQSSAGRTVPLPLSDIARVPKCPRR